MWRVITSTIAALTLYASVASAQQPCTSNANRVMSDIYRTILDRGVDQGAQSWVNRLANGEVTVKELVRGLANSQEYQQRFGQTRIFGAQNHQNAVADLYRRLLDREADASGLQAWTRTAQQRGLSAVVDGLMDSQEYASKYGDWGVPGSGLRFCANGGNQSSGGFGRYRGSRRAADYDFDALDANGNNRIERREWQARLDEFNRLDINGNNVLSRAELERTADTVGTAGQTIPVGGDRQWIDTGINVRAGETIIVSADGQIRLSRNNRDFATAAGSTQGRRIAGSPIPSAPAGALLMRIGNMSPMFVGDNRTIRAARGGRLYLGVNDDYFDDNTGQFNVTVDVN